MPHSHCYSYTIVFTWRSIQLTFGTGKKKNRSHIVRSYPSRRKYNMYFPPSPVHSPEHLGLPSRPVARICIYRPAVSSWKKIACISLSHPVEKISTVGLPSVPSRPVKLLYRHCSVPFRLDNLCGCHFTVSPSNIFPPNKSKTIPPSRLDYQIP